MHLDGELLSQAGVFELRRGRSVLARVVSAILRLPPAACAVPTRLLIARSEGGERWTRLFGDRVLVTTQAARARCCLGERLRFVEFVFRLEVTDGALRWALTVMALGVFVSGLRDLYAALELPHGNWPWVREYSHS
jgi:hypothetical protein